jgi:hypothetical protein
MDLDLMTMDSRRQSGYISWDDLLFQLTEPYRLGQVVFERSWSLTFTSARRFMPPDMFI